MIPAALTSRPRWVRHPARSKRPFTRYGRPASVADPKTWTTFEKASDWSVGVGAGLGFVLNGDGVACIDLDHCLTPAEEAEPLSAYSVSALDVLSRIRAGEKVLAGWAAEILAANPATYVEISPSGTGLHIWGLAHFERGRRVRSGGRAVEVYGDRRYMTVTGVVFDDRPLVLAPLVSPL